MPGIRDVNVNLAAQGERFSIMLTLTYGPLSGQAGDPPPANTVSGGGRSRSELAVKPRGTMLAR